VLWPLLHYIIWNNATDGRLESKQWEAYKAVNQRYADFVSEIYQDGDISKVLYDQLFFIIFNGICHSLGT
jgi:trehalose-6-phosphate synthase